MEIFIWGTGFAAQRLNEIYANEIREENIIGYIDNDPSKLGKMFCGKRIYSPEVLQDNRNAAIYISVMEKKEEICQQISSQYPYYETSILEDNYFKKLSLIKRYQNSEDDEAKEIVKYLAGHPLQFFNYPFVEGYKEDKIFIGIENGLYYTVRHGKKLFFSQDYDTEQKAREYYLSLLIEQDVDSPHRYLTESFQVPDGAVVIDAGTAEGIFSLDIIDLAKRIYIFEPDRNWIDALKYTFESYMDKVVIINKCVSDYTDGGTVTIDDSIKEIVDFIKMDIEGEEYYALQGAKKVLGMSPDAKCVICSYHQEFAYEAIKNLLEKWGFQTTHSKGYMWYTEHFNKMRPPVLRRGLIYAEKK